MAGNDAIAPDPQWLRDELNKRTAGYNELNFLENFGMYMANAQLLEMAVKRVLVGKFNEDFDEVEDMSLGILGRRMRRNGVREEILAGLTYISESRNHIAHALLAEHHIWVSVMGNRMHNRQERDLDKAYLELMSFNLGFEHAEENDLFLLPQ